MRGRSGKPSDVPSQLVTRAFIRQLLGTGKRSSPTRLGRYGADDVELLLTFLAALPNALIKDFLKQRKLPRSGNKVGLFQSIKKGLDEKKIRYGDLIDLLDASEPWAKQHVFLLDMGADSTDWNTDTKVRAAVAAHGLRNVVNHRRQLLLPDSLTINHIVSTPQSLRISAVERRVGYLPNDELSYEEEGADGSELCFRAFEKKTTRGLIMFEWDFLTNDAFLQVTQLPMHERYEHAKARFLSLVSQWFPTDAIIEHSLASAIVEFHRRERDNEGGVRSHRVELRAIDGRRMTGQSTRAKQPLLGNDDIDTALEGIEQKGGTGHLGNFYLLPEDGGDGGDNPIDAEDEIHVMLIGNRNRFHIMTAQTEDVIRYAIRCIRDASNAQPASQVPF